ncbi:MAG: outer membrane lipoprotein-sorting protein [Desulfobacterales bacterium]|nr:outer membrane lipoprotein-sorting protein [Desulfobacterales bacterium]
MIQFITIGLLFLMIPISAPAIDINPQELVEKSFTYFRGKTSIALVEMTIHRSKWERKMTINSWTREDTDSVFVIIDPPKDKGNATLKKGKEMWMYNPKVNRVIKLPPSMMSQSWMGSDFSNNDLAKSDTLIHDYVHTLESTEIHDGKTVYCLKSIPKIDAPVVWGMQKLKIREDLVFLSQAFYDEDLQLVKIMNASDIQVFSGKLFPKLWKMEQANQPDEYTLLEYKQLEFEKKLPDDLFNLTSLKTLHMYIDR